MWVKTLYKGLEMDEKLLLVASRLTYQIPFIRIIVTIWAWNTCFLNFNRLNESETEKNGKQKQEVKVSEALDNVQAI